MSDTVRRTNKVLVVLVVRTNFRCVDNNTLIKLCQAFSVFFLTFLFLCVTILYYFITSRVLMNNTNTTKITVFITVALKKALPKILGMPYFISISAYSYLSSVFIVGNFFGSFTYPFKSLQSLVKWAFPDFILFPTYGRFFDFCASKRCHSP